MKMQQIFNKLLTFQAKIVSKLFAKLVDPLCKKLLLELPRTSLHDINEQVYYPLCEVMRASSGLLKICVVLCMVEAMQ